MHDPPTHVAFGRTTSPIARADDTFTATLADGSQTSAAFAIEPRDICCLLYLDTRPFDPDSPGSWLLTDGPPY